MQAPSSSQTNAPSDTSGGPLVRSDGTRDEDRGELRYVTSGVADAITCGVRPKLAERAQAIREGKR